MRTRGPPGCFRVLVRVSDDPPDSVATSARRTASGVESARLRAELVAVHSASRLYSPIAAYKAEDNQPHGAGILEQDPPTDGKLDDRAGSQGVVELNGYPAARHVDGFADP